jgi:hypothetical protein
MRPCGTKNRAPNRYTRKELEELARKKGIKNIPKKNMDELCKELRLVPIQKKKVSPIKKPETIKIPPIPPKFFKKCNPTHINAYRPNYSCNPLTGRWNKKKGSLPYHFKYQLQSMNLDNLKIVAKKLSLNTDTANKNKLIKDILEKQYPLVKGKQISKNVQLFKQKLLKLYLQKKNTYKESIVVFNYYNNKISTQSPDFAFSESLVKNPITLSLPGTYNMIQYKKMLGNDIDGLLNNKRWFQMQADYQKKLPFLKQLFILNYTLRGDRVVNHTINNLFRMDYFLNLEKVEPGIHWSNKEVFPLYPIFIHVMTTDYNKWKTIFLKNKGTIKLLKGCGISGNHEVIKPKSVVFQNYKYTMDNVFRSHSIKHEFFKLLAEEYVKELNKIIIESPPLSHNLIVYKGVRGMDYLNFSEKNTYTNKQFISTSFNFKYSLHFPRNYCCMQKIFLLKGTRVLFPVMSYFTEYELILPPNRKMYAVSKPYIPNNNTNKTINLVITN